MIIDKFADDIQPLISNVSFFGQNPLQQEYFEETSINLVECV